MSIVNVIVKQAPDMPPSRLLRDIHNGTFFTGTINGYVSAGPFLKVGSISCNVWFVFKLEHPDGGNYCSLRACDREATVTNYRTLSVAEIELRDRIGEALPVANQEPSIHANPKEP